MESNEYTENKIRDVAYGYRLYRINDDVTIESKIFDTFEGINTEYKYFKTDDFIEEIYGVSYNLTPSIK